MREIKFEYIYKHSKDGDIQKETFSLEQIETFGLRTYEPIAELLKEDGYILIAKRQYTGLLDKNGVEIYEGDIVNVFGLDDDPIDIIFKNGAFGYMSIGKHSYFISIAGNTNFSYDENLLLDFEVIGNIYENKDLLCD